MVACYGGHLGGHLDIAQYLIAQGTVVNARDNVSGAVYDEL